MKVNGNLTVDQHGKVHLKEPSSVAVAGALDLHDAMMTYVPVVGPVLFCQAINIPTISMGSSVGDAPRVHTLDGVSALATYTTHTLTVGLERQVVDATKECVKGELVSIDRNKLTGGHIGGIVAGAALLAIIIFAATVWCCTKSDRDIRMAEVQARLLKSREDEAQRQRDLSGSN